MSSANFIRENHELMASMAGDGEISFADEMRLKVAVQRAGLDDEAALDVDRFLTAEASRAIELHSLVKAELPSALAKPSAAAIRYATNLNNRQIARLLVHSTLNSVGTSETLIEFVSRLTNNPLRANGVVALLIDGEDESGYFTTTAESAALAVALLNSEPTEGLVRNFSPKTLELLRDAAKQHAVDAKLGIEMSAKAEQALAEQQANQLSGACVESDGNSACGPISNDKPEGCP